MAWAAVGLRQVADFCHCWHHFRPARCEGQKRDLHLAKLCPEAGGRRERVGGGYATCGQGAALRHLPGGLILSVQREWDNAENIYWDSMRGFEKVGHAKLLKTAKSPTPPLSYTALRRARLRTAVRQAAHRRTRGRCPGLPGAVEIAADVRGRPPLFSVAYSPKAPQKWLERA